MIEPTGAVAGLLYPLPAVFAFLLCSEFGPVLEKKSHIDVMESDFTSLNIYKGLIVPQNYYVCTRGEQ